MIHYLETGSTDPCYNLAFEQYVLENKRDGDWLILWQNNNTVVPATKKTEPEAKKRSTRNTCGSTASRSCAG